ncbi:MAG TPA: hypothetical protein VFZ05_03680 [Nitrososphaera sp.]
MTTLFSSTMRAVPQFSCFLYAINSNVWSPSSRQPIAPSAPTSPCPLPKVWYEMSQACATFSAICRLDTSHIASALNFFNCSGTFSDCKNAMPGFAPDPMSEPSSTACLTYRIALPGSCTTARRQTAPLPRVFQGMFGLSLMRSG